MTHSQLFMTMKLVITSTDPVPVEINPASVIVYRQDMKTMQEEADTMIIQQVADVRPKRHSLQMTQMVFLCCLFSFVAKKIDFNFCRNGLARSWLHSVIHQCHC